MSLAASASDLLLAILSLQSTNLLAYFLAGYGKRSALSAEAAVKYMAFCSVAGAFLLYGLAILLFAPTHSLNIYEIHQALLATRCRATMLLVIFMLIFLALPEFSVRRVSDVPLGARRARRARRRRRRRFCLSGRARRVSRWRSGF